MTNDVTANASILGFFRHYALGIMSVDASLWSYRSIPWRLRWDDVVRDHRDVVRSMIQFRFLVSARRDVVISWRRWLMCVSEGGPRGDERGRGTVWYVGSCQVTAELMVCFVE